MRQQIAGRVREGVKINHLSRLKWWRGLGLSEGLKEVIIMAV
jgi:hypothetical protein